MAVKTQADLLCHLCDGFFLNDRNNATKAESKKMRNVLLPGFFQPPLWILNVGETE